MKSLNKISFLVLALGLFFAWPLISKAENQKINLYFFHGDGCPHCADEKDFLEALSEEDPDLTIFQYEVWYNGKNQRLIQKISEELDIPIQGVPVLFIQGVAVHGYQSDETTGKEIKKTIRLCREKGCEDPVGKILGLDTYDPKPNDSQYPNPVTHSNQDPLTQRVIPETIKVPLFGEITVRNLSLPALSVILGILDGFNPCAMWVLLFLISLLIGMENKKRMWILGSCFIVASAVTYFLFMTAWLNLFLFIGLIFWVRLLIGAVALGSGGYQIREFWVNKDAACKVINAEKKRKMMDRLKNITQTKKFHLALVGIISLAFAVNLIELVCSAGLPAVYTSILALSEIPVWQYYSYILLYIVFFMIDDLIVFLIAMTTLKTIGLTTQYTRYFNLIGGILMLLIGLLLIFKPGWLMFG